MIGSVGTLLCSLLATLYFGKQDVRLVDKELAELLVWSVRECGQR